jgi:hypothetical protein
MIKSVTCVAYIRVLPSEAATGSVATIFLSPFSIPFPVEQRNLGLPQLGDVADEGEDHGGGGLSLSFLSGS